MQEIFFGRKIFLKQFCLQNLFFTPKYKDKRRIFVLQKIFTSCKSFDEIVRMMKMC